LSNTNDPLKFTFEPSQLGNAQVIFNHHNDSIINIGNRLSTGEKFSETPKQSTKKPTKMQLRRSARKSQENSQNSFYQSASTIKE